MEDIPNALKIINQVKIFEFLRELGFEYITDAVYDDAYLDNVSDEDKSIIKTSTPEGLFSLKKHIENNIISKLKELFPDNEFVQNLVYNEIYLSLFGRNMGYYGSKINLSDKQFEDQFITIKLAYDKLSQEMIDGHSVGE
jgi:hypothetical protein